MGDCCLFTKRRCKVFNYFVGIDVGKIGFSVAILDTTLKPTHKFTAKMNKEGFEKLLSTLSTIGKREEILIGMESSGSYHFNLFYFLTFKGFTVVTINPLLVKQFAQLSLRKCKTDKRDAITIAKFLIHERGKVNNITVPNGLRELARERESLCCKVARIKTEIKQLIHKLFPEIEQRCFIFSKSMLGLLGEYPSATRLGEAKPEEVRKFLKGRARVSAEEIIKLAQSSIGVKSEAVELVLVTKIMMLKVAQEALDKLTQSLVNTANLLFHRELEIITSIKGIEEVSASHFMAEIGGYENFSKNKGIIAYAGVDPTVYESGRYKGKSKISKRGNSHLRRVLWIMAVNVVMSNPYFRTYFMKKRAEGKPYKMAILCGS